MKICSLYILLFLYLTVCWSCSNNSQEKTCVVSGEVLGSHGDPYIHKHDGANIKFCCEPCVKKFNENPKKYLVKLGK